MNVRSVAEHKKTLHTLSERWAQLLHASKWTELAVCFLIGLLLSASRIGNHCAPFAIAMIATLGGGSGGLSCFAGALVGYYAAFGFTAGTQMTAGSALAFAACCFLHRREWLYTSWAPAAIATSSYFVTRVAVVAATGGFSAMIAVRMAMQLAVCAASAFSFQDAMDLSEPCTAASAARKSVSTVITIGCLLIGISGFVIFGSFSVGRVLIFLILLIISMGGALPGATGGVVLGLALDLSAGGFYFSAFYPATGLIGGLASKHKKWSYCAVCLLTYSLILFLLPNKFLLWFVLAEGITACVVFLVLPKSWLVTLGSFVQPVQTGRGESGLRHLLAGRIGGMSHAYRALYDVAQEAAGFAENDNDIAKVFDRTADRVCLHCPLREECWVASGNETLNAMNDASLIMQQRGMLETADFPKYFQERCVCLHEFTEVVNGELRLRAYRRQMRQIMQDERALLFEQYKDFSDVLADSARALDSLNGSDPLAERRLIRYLRTLGIEADAAVFRDDRGRLHAAIDSKSLRAVIDLPEFLDGVSSVLGVRLCIPERQIKEDSLILLEAEPLSVSVGIAAVRKHGQSVSGDRGTYFKTDSGKLCVILSDGMGTGAEAADGSINAIRILERFLRAGVSPSAAMKLLNAASLAQDDEKWGYATVDLMCIDLFTGDACFYKYGAAPSYVKTGTMIRKIKCKSYAAGLKYEAGKVPDVMHVRLKPGSIAVIASDGVVSDGKDLWLRKLLEKTTAENMKTLAGGVIRSAVREYGRNDDMTALAVKLEVRQ